MQRAGKSGFSVAEDYSVTGIATGTPAQLAVLQAQAPAHTAEIRTRAGELVAADQQAAAEIARATTGIGENTRFVDFKQSPGDATETPQVPGGGYGSYHYDYEFSTSESWSKEQIMSEIQKHLNNYFTFTADTGELVNGATVNLTGRLGENEPVQVTGLTPDSFSFVSLPGHNEGAGRTIAFSVVPSTRSPLPGRLSWELRVAASGPLSKGSLIPGASWLNEGVWQVFADNIAATLPAVPLQPGLVSA